MTIQGISPQNQTLPQKTAPKCDCPQDPASPKDSFIGGLKLGLGYSLDPIGVSLETAEQTLVNGKGPRENTFKSAFMDVAGDIHKDHSLSRYLGEGIGLLAGGAMQSATGGVIALVTGAITFAAGGYGIAKTLSSDAPAEASLKSEGTFNEGLRAGFGVAIDPFGTAVENAESFLVNGKGIHENKVRTVAEDLTVDAHKSSWNLKKVIGAVAGIVGGTACNMITGGLLPLGTAIADVIKTMA